MTPPNTLTSTVIRAIAAQSISWVIEDDFTLLKSLGEKLRVPLGALPSAVASLAPPELLELKKTIVRLDSMGALPGPLDATELCGFLNSIAGTDGPAGCQAPSSVNS